MTDSNKVLEIIKQISEQIQMEKDFLTELDNVIGDGDHGINMARGFKEVEKKLADFSGKDIGSILKAVGMTLVSTVGGASGPLYGTAFMKAGAAVGAKNEMDGGDFLNAMDAAIEGIKMRGKAHEGEKTMLDALIPAYNAIKKTYEENNDFKAAISQGVEAAEKGVEYTKTIIATKGRASYLGERSIGHQDPGATSSCLMLKVIQRSL
ncbi:dihydroxyacetone kinase subunit DhaL [Caproiciproducens galactitolivorans]|uniref:Dihydroxyacetone kinase subunit DhaL n=1 Tax=Caproiciproducens galactitolivorans TaxID=642589 RepID=A0ABT4BSI5_9FIRM|nr:dihydroxyacetone kinase subunit DhaL [Caproiciproducens galactitolivorans]MCY1713856.1 dihydroxyacetone kinase subunit DhaL [Caproiciproducens galactitolivorans]